MFFATLATQFQSANYDSDYCLTVGMHSPDKFFNDLDSMLEQGRRKVWNIEGAQIVGLRVSYKNWQGTAISYQKH